MKVNIIVGLAFGDEGKGKTVAKLSSPNDLVIRFNGGHQCGHTVVHGDYRHVFSSFGSGTLKRAHTYISEYCTLYPKSYYNEQKELIKNGFEPMCYVHPLTMITTPFDIDHNRETEGINKHGSVGMGFGATIQRNETTPYKLYAIDLTYRPALLNKLHQIAAYYRSKDAEKQIETFLYYVDKLELNLKTLSDIKDNYNHIIFEGGQGIMLDMDFGFFPHVTRSNTTSKNAMQIIKDNDLPAPTVHYVMRSYLTRHGNGYMPNEEKAMGYEDKTNITHKYQGEFRQGYHSMEMLQYAMDCDCIYSGNDYSKKKLVINCLDQTNDFILIDGDIMQVNEFINKLNKPMFKPAKKLIR